MSAPPPVEKGNSASGAVDQSARKDFESHDWERDAQWQRYLQGVELPALPALEAAALRRLKRKYWLRSVVSCMRLPPHTARYAHTTTSSYSYSLQLLVLVLHSFA
jgi:hypothetical protein